MGRRLLMLDHDGVVADTFDVISMALVDACHAIGLVGVESEEDVLDLFDGNVYDRLRALGADDAGIREIERRTTRTIHNALPWIQAFPLMPQLLDELGDSAHLVIISSSDEDVIWAFLHRHRITGVAEVAGSRAGESKAAKMRTAMRRFPEQEAFWFVGDTAGDMREALIAGATPCGVGWGWHSPDRLLEAGAVAVAGTPAELLEIVSPGQAADFWD